MQEVSGSTPLFSTIDLKRGWNAGSGLFFLPNFNVIPAPAYARAGSGGHGLSNP
jgi:hypothetical protein